MLFAVKDLQDENDWNFFKELDYQSYILSIKEAYKLSEEELHHKYREFDASDNINPRDSNHKIFILWHNEETRAGLIWLCNREPFWRFKQKLVWIYNLHIIAEFRGQDLARKLMTKAEEWCLEQNLNTLALHALEDNTAVRSLYENLNYKLVETNNESCFYEKIL